MKGYKKPRCDCKTFLQAFRSEYWKVARAITNNGELIPLLMILIMK